jgi:hypothetical protein
MGPRQCLAIRPEDASDALDGVRNLLLKQKAKLFFCREPKQTFSACCPTSRPGLSLRGNKQHCRTKGTYLRDKFYRLKARRGYKGAAVAIAHKILVSIYHMFSQQVSYNDRGDLPGQAQQEPPHAQLGSSARTFGPLSDIGTSANPGKVRKIIFMAVIARRVLTFLNNLLDRESIT